MWQEGGGRGEGGRKGQGKEEHSAPSYSVPPPAPHLGELLGDASEHVVVQLPGLSELLHITSALELLAPLVGLSQITAIGLGGGRSNENEDYIDYYTNNVKNLATSVNKSSKGSGSP